MTIEEILDKYTDYLECDEYHIHDGTGEHEGTTPPPHDDFDDTKAKAAILKNYRSVEVIKKAVGAVETYSGPMARISTPEEDRNKLRAEILQELGLL